MRHSAAGLRIDAIQGSIDDAVRSDPHAHGVTHDMQRTGEVALSDRDLQLLLILGLSVWSIGTMHLQQTIIASSLRETCFC